jgi:hypothetical protein
LLFRVKAKVKGANNTISLYISQTFLIGQELLQKLQQYSDVAMRGEESVTTLDNLEAQKQVKRLIQYIESRVEKIRAYLEDRDMTLNVEVQRDSVQREIRQVRIASIALYKQL